MATLRLPLPESDDSKYKREKRSRRKTERRAENLDTAAVPDRACLTCTLWRSIDGHWGDCGAAVVTAAHVSAEQYPPRGIERGTVIARHEDGWWHAQTFGKSTPLKTHRTFEACSRYERGMSQQTTTRRGPSLLERVRAQEGRG